MPTSHSEAETIVNICKDYMSVEQMAELFTKLDKEVGQKTGNDSLKVSLAMLNGLVPTIPPQVPTPTLFWWMAFWVVVVVHFAIVGGVFTSFFTLPFLWPIEIWLPLNVLIFNLGCTRGECKLTALENHIRQRLGKKRIGGFIGYYIVKPVRRRILA